MTIRTVVHHAIAGLIGCMAVTSAMAADSTIPGQRLTIAEQADTDQFEQLLHDSLHSSNMRLRVLVGRAFDPSSESMASTLTPIDTLAEQVRGSTDPFVLASMVESCGNDRLKPRPTCDPVEMATRWTVADAQNQVAWLTLASTLRTRGDKAGESQAFQRAARASTWHEFYDDGTRVVLQALPSSLGAYGRVVVLQVALTSAAAYLLPHSAIFELHQYCKNAGVREECLRILDTIDRDGGTFFSKSVGIRIGQAVGLDPLLLAARTRRLDALRDAESASQWKELADLANPVEQAAQAALLERRIALGELGWAQKQLADSGVSESAAADRYHAAAVARRERAIAENRSAAN